MNPEEQRRVRILQSDRCQCGEEPSRVEALEARLQQIRVMLDRARQRGEQLPTAPEVIDFLLAPRYVRALFRNPGDEAFAEYLVDRIFTTRDTSESKKPR
jgi:tetracycline repressor-like protein